MILESQISKRDLRPQLLGFIPKIVKYLEHVHTRTSTQLT
jgi:aminoglycoside/choline kinase family phosphotransferase